MQNGREPSRNARAEAALGVEKQPASGVPPFSVGYFTGQRDHGSVSFSPGADSQSIASTAPVHPFAALFPRSVTTFPRSLQTPFSAGIGMRSTSSKRPDITVRKSSMLSRRSHV